MRSHPNRSALVGGSQLAVKLRDLAILAAALVAGYCCLESESIGRGLAPRPVALLYGYEPWNRDPPPADLPPAAPILFDEVLQFLPWQELTRRELEAGRIPLWNPYQFSGAPHLAAAQPAVLSPISLLALPRSTLAQHISRGTGFLIAGVGTHLWLASLGLGASACWFGAVSFAFCGFLTLWAGHPHFLSAVWLPWMLLGVERLRAPLFCGMLTVAAAMAFSLLGGHVETSFHLALVAAIYAVFRAPRTLPGLAAGGVLGAGLAAVAILPFLEYLLESSALASRHGGFELSRALPWPALASLAVPGFSGGWPFGPFLLERANLNEVAGGACGPVALALALSARGSRQVRPLVAVLALCLLLAFEPWPVGAIAARLPMISLAYNGRLLLAVALMVAALGALGMNSIPKVPSPLAPFPRGGRGVPFGDRVQEAAEPTEQVARQVRVARLARLAPGVAGCVVVALLCVGLAGVSRAQLGWDSILVHIGCLGVAAILVRVPRRTAGLGLSAVAMLPGIWLAHGYHGGGPTAPWPALGPPELTGEGSTRFAAFGYQALPAEVATAYALRDIRGYDAMTPRRYDELLSKLEPLARQPGRLGIFRLRALTEWIEGVYEFLGVRVVFVGRGSAGTAGVGQGLADELASGFRPLGGGFWVRETAGRARFATSAKFLADESSVLRYVTSEEFDPDVPGFVGIEAEGTRSDVAARNDSSPSVRIVEDEPMSVTLELEAPEPGYVVLADTEFPGWQVYVDGVAGKSMRANHSFRAVAVNAGAREVRWIYRPESFLVGAFVSSIFLGVVVACSALRLGGRSIRRTTSC